MEQAGSMTRRIQHLKLAGFVSFVAFSVCALILTLGTMLQGPIYALASMAMVLYIIGIRFGKFVLVSLSWLLVGISFMVSWILLSPFADNVTVFLWTTLLIASFDVSHFAATVQPVAGVLSNLPADSVTRLRRVVRQHILTSVLLIGSSFFLSIAITRFSSTLLVLGSPILGMDPRW
jgi:hypothetical protein